jgi:hypothetical protein
MMELPEDHVPTLPALLPPLIVHYRGRSHRHCCRRRQGRAGLLLTKGLKMKITTQRDPAKSYRSLCPVVFGSSVEINQPDMIRTCSPHLCAHPISKRFRHSSGLNRSIRNNQYPIVYGFAIENKLRTKTRRREQAGAPASHRQGRCGGWRSGGGEQEGAAEDEAVVAEEDLSGEEADSAGPVKWVVPAAWEVLPADRGGGGQG